jgi:hypothetical protein
MKYLYHYCAKTKEEDNTLTEFDGIASMPTPMSLSNYHAFCDQVSETMTRSKVMISSLSFLGIEEE